MSKYLCSLISLLMAGTPRCVIHSCQMNTFTFLSPCVRAPLGTPFVYDYLMNFNICILQGVSSYLCKISLLTDVPCMYAHLDASSILVLTSLLPCPHHSGILPVSAVSGDGLQAALEWLAVRLGSNQVRAKTFRVAGGQVPRPVPQHAVLSVLLRVLQHLAEREYQETRDQTEQLSRRRFPRGFGERPEFSGE